MSGATGDPFWLNDPSVLIDTSKHLEFFPDKLMTYEEKLNSIVRFGFYISVIISLYKGNFRPFVLFLMTLILTYVMYSYNINVPDISLSLPQRVRENFGFRSKFEDTFDPETDTDPVREQIFRDNFSHDYDPRISQGEIYNSGVSITDSGDVCTAPTDVNPFMNVTPEDHKYAPRKPRACDKQDTINGVKIKDLENQAFENAVYSSEATHPLSTDLYGQSSYEKYQFHTLPESSAQISQNEFAMALYGPGLAKNCKMNAMDCEPPYRKDVRVNNKTTNAGFINNPIGGERPGTSIIGDGKPTHTSISGFDPSLVADMNTQF